MRGELFRLPRPSAAQDNEQRGARYAVIVQADGTDTHVLFEQTTVIDPRRLGASAGRLEADELRAVDDALSLVLGI